MSLEILFFLSFVNTCTFSQMVHVLILFTPERQQHVFLARLFGYHCDMMSEKRMWRREFGIYFYIVVCFHSLLFTVNQDMCALLFSSILFHLYFCSLFSTEHSIWDCWTLSLQHNDIDLNMIFVLLFALWLWFQSLQKSQQAQMTRWNWNVRSHSAAAAAALNLTYFIFQFHTYSPHGVAEREKELCTYITSDSDYGNNILKVVLVADTEEKKKQEVDIFGAHTRESQSTVDARTREMAEVEKEKCVSSAVLKFLAWWRKCLNFLLANFFSCFPVF